MIDQAFIRFIVQDFNKIPIENVLNKIKINNLKEFDVLSSKAIEILQKQNVAIVRYNSSQRWYVKAADCFLWMITLGCIRLLRQERNLKKADQVIKKIRVFIQSTPLYKQAWRTDHHKLVPYAKMVQGLRRRKIQTRHVKAIKIQRAWRFHLRFKFQAKEQTYEQWKIRAMKRKWEDETGLEVQRLTSKGNLPENGKQAISTLSKHFKYLVKIAEKRDLTFVVAGRAREIRNQYRHTHYVFTHAQSLEISVVNQCIHELLRQFTPELFHPLTRPFRVPFTVPHTPNIDAFFKKYDFKAHNFQDNKHNAEFLSVDSYFWNTQPAESALSYLIWGNSENLNRNKKAGFNIFKDLFTHYLPDAYLCECIAKRIHAVALEKKKENAIGTLYVICVPKKVVENPDKNFVYRSHPFGRPCDCFSNHLEILNKTQNDEVLYCKDRRIPQYRLLTSRLTEEKGVRTFAVNALSKAKRKNYNQLIKNFVRELAFYSSIFQLKAVPDDLENQRLMKEIQEVPYLDQGAINYLITLKFDCMSEVLREAMQFKVLH